MGRKLDLSGLSDNEAEHVLQVVQRDMRLRKKEEERLSELKQALDEEGSRCLLLSRQRYFNQRCCIRCCAPFSFLLNPKRQCRDCLYNVCKACRLYSKPDKAWLCCACQKSRLLKQQSLDWFYTHVKGRFKRFGSAKVLKTIYRRHLAEHSPVSELTEGSTYEESICNEGSVCGSDATFYKQTEEHSMAETLTVAFRVAEEAIDEAISNAEFDAASQENQNEAHYLREHRGELIEELAKTIMQKIITRRKTLVEMRDEYEREGSLEHNAHHPGDQAGETFKHLKGLWRSRSAFSLMDDNRDARQTSPEEGGSTVSPWTNVERMENSGVSSVLKSPDGNWIALQSAQLSRPSLLAKRKSQVYSALERESGAVSAYEGMDSDNEAKPELGSSWGAILQEFHRKLTGSKVRRDAANRHDAWSDSEGKLKKSPVAIVRRQMMPMEGRLPSSHRTSIIDITFNRKATPDESGAGSEAASGKAKRSRKKRRSKRRATLSGPLSMDYNKKDVHSCSHSDVDTPDTLTPDAVTPDLLHQNVDISQVEQELTLDAPQPFEHISNSSVREEGLCHTKGSGDAQAREVRSQDDEKDKDLNEAETEENRNGHDDTGNERIKNLKTEVDLARSRVEDEKVEEEEEEEMKSRLYKLVAKSRLAYFSSTDDELDRAGKSEEDQGCDGKDHEEETEGLTHQLSQLEKEVRSTTFSSTEEELDRITDEEAKKEGEEEEDEEALEVRLCRLANQAGATQFSSTEDELDRDEAAHEETLWRLQEYKAAQATQVRHLASLVSASQFSSTEDELDRVGEDEQKMMRGEEPWGEMVGRHWESMGEEPVEDPMSDNFSDAAVEALDGDGTESEKAEERTRRPELDQLEVKLVDQKAEREEEDIRKENVGKWESEEEDVEFNKIITSMLTLTLEDIREHAHAEEKKKDGKSDMKRDKDPKTDEERKDDTMTNGERTGDTTMDKRQNEDTNTDDEWKEDEKTDKNKNQDEKTDEERSKDAKIDEERKDDEMTNEERNKDSKKDENRDDDDDYIKSLKDTDNEKRVDSKTDKDKNEDLKTDEDLVDEMKEDSNTHENRNRDASTDETKEDENRNKDVEPAIERKDDMVTNEETNQSTKTDGRKDDENTEKNRSMHVNTDKHRNEAIGDLKEDTKTDQDCNKDAKEDGKQENRNEEEKTEKERTVDSIINEERNEDTNTNKDSNKNVKMDKETSDVSKEEAKTSDNTKMASKTDERNEDDNGNKDAKTTKRRNDNIMTNEESNEDIKKDTESNEDTKKDTESNEDTKTADERKEEEKRDEKWNKDGNTDRNNDVKTDKETEDEKNTDLQTDETRIRDTKTHDTKEATKTDDGRGLEEDRKESNDDVKMEKKMEVEKKEGSMTGENQNAKEGEERKVETMTNKESFEDTQTDEGWNRAVEDQKEHVMTDNSRDENINKDRIKAAEDLTEETNTDNESNTDVNRDKETCHKMEQDMEAKTDERDRNEDAKTNKSKDKSKTEKGRKEDFKTEKTDMERKDNMKSDDVRKEDTKADDNTSKERQTDNDWNKDARTDTDKNKEAKTDKGRNKEVQTNTDSNEEGKDPKTTRDWNKDLSKDANTDRDKDAKIDTDWNLEGNAQKDWGKDAQTDTDKKEESSIDNDGKKNANTDIDWRKDAKTDEDYSEDAQTSKYRNKDAKTDNERSEDLKKNYNDDNAKADKDAKSDQIWNEESKMDKERQKHLKTDKDQRDNTWNVKKSEDAAMSNKNKNKDMQTDKEGKDPTKTENKRNEHSKPGQNRNKVKVEKDWNEAETQENRTGDDKTGKERKKNLRTENGKYKATNSKTENDKDAKTDEIDVKEVQGEQISLLEDAEKRTVEELSEMHKSAALPLSHPAGRQQEQEVATAKDEDPRRKMATVEEDFPLPEEIRNASDAEVYHAVHFISTLLEQRYSAASLCSITTEVLKVLNATEELLQGVEGRQGRRPSALSLPPDADPKELDQQFSALEEKVYVAAGSVYGVEDELGALEERARGISSSTSDTELFFLEEQVASAAARVQQSELQISDISARIASLRSAGLDVDPQSRFAKARTVPVMPLTLSSSRQLRRRLPALPRPEDNKS